MNRRESTWRQICLEAIRRKERGMVPFVKLYVLAARSWQSCACRSLRDDERLWDSGAPNDAQLREIGYAFTNAVADDQDPHAALALDKRIRDRIKEIRRRMS